MARTITTIHTELKENFIANSDLQTAYGFSEDDDFDDVFSKTSIENLMLYNVAVSIHTLEGLLDTHEDAVNEALDELKPHSEEWYSEMAKAFQYGDSLVEDEDYYETEDEDKQIVSNAAVTSKSGKLYIKVATERGDDLTALSDAQLSAFEEYMERIKDAGVKITYISQDGDDLKLSMDIWYDPLVLNSEGVRLDDSSTEPAKETIEDFIKDLPFNGEFVLTDLVTALQDVEGIDIATVLSAESKYGDYDYSTIDAKVTPEAGYLVIDDDNLTLNYRANV